MKNESIWNNYLKEKFLELNEDIECDILIIGGGIAGILSAYELSKSNKKIVLVERNKLFSGVTSKMTAKVTVLEDILKKISDKDIDKYIKSQLEGLDLLKENILNNNIDSCFKENKSYLFTMKKSNIKKLKNIYEHLKNNKVKVKEANFKFNNIEALFAIEALGYEINPIKYLNGIRDSLTNVLIYENTSVDLVLKDDGIFTVKTNNKHEIKALKIIFATNYPYFLKPLLFPLKVHLEKSYIGYGDTESLNEGFNAINIDKEVHSIRFYNGKMIYLTGSSTISNKVNAIKNFNKLKESPLFKDISNLWSNMDIITNDSLPIIGEVLKDMYIITGFNTWGILSSHVGASLLASLILGKKKNLKYKELFNPKKKINLKKFLNSSLNVYDSINGYLKGLLNKNKMVFYSKDNAMYVAKDGKCYLVKRKCPHLKCNLIFNSVEKTWDCPCHGSRFDLYGNVISGPSKYNIKVKSVK